MRQVFCYTGDTAHDEMQKACFDYLRLGGWYSEGPISLLSGLKPSPSFLIMHFFAVAIFGVGRLLLPRPTFRCAKQMPHQQRGAPLAMRDPFLSWQRALAGAAPAALRQLHHLSDHPL